MQRRDSNDPAIPLEAGPSHSRAPANWPAIPESPAIEPTSSDWLLVCGITNLLSRPGTWAVEQITEWKTNLQQIISRGPEMVPAIREFLAKNIDFPFGPQGLQALGYPSARVALIDALVQIGGPEAIDALTATLHTTADPLEIARLAQSLEKLEPDQHQQAALIAAREALAMAAEGKLPGRDVAPLFEVVQRYGDASLVPELEQNARKWGYYSMVALTQLPEGAGIPSLLQIATGPKWSNGAQDAAWQMVAQVASQWQEARAVLLEQVRQNKLSAFNWASMSALLAGDQIYFRNSALNPPSRGMESSSTVSGDQSLYAAPAPEDLTTERLSQQVELIEELSRASTDPTARRALQQARALVFRRLSQAAAAAHP